MLVFYFESIYKFFMVLFLFAKVDLFKTKRYRHDVSCNDNVSDGNCPCLSIVVHNVLCLQRGSADSNCCPSFIPVFFVLYFLFRNCSSSITSFSFTYRVSVVPVGLSPPPADWKDRTSGKLENSSHSQRKISWTVPRPRVCCLCSLTQFIC